MINSTIYSSLDAVKARVQIYDGNGVLITTCTCADVLSDFAVSREGVGGKFFGFGICHKLELNIIDIERTFQFYKGYYAEISYGNGYLWDRCYPKFYFEDIKVDKRTGDIKVVAYDRLKQLANHKYSELGITGETKLFNIVSKTSDLMGFKKKYATSPTDDKAYLQAMNTSSVTPNYEGDEDLRVVLDEIAEWMQLVYYLNAKEELTWKKVCIDIDPVAYVYPKDYYEWEQEEKLVLKNLYATNELSDTAGIVIDANGNVLQYIRENQLLANRDDISDILTTYSAQYSHHPFVLDWSGDYRLEAGDCIEIYDNDSTTTKVFILNDLVTYAGTLSQATAWEWVDNDSEKEESPITIQDKINQTYAKVDKVNKEITLLASTVDTQGSNIAQLLVSSNSVTTKVTDIESKHNTEVDNVNDRIDTLTKETAMKVDAEGVEIIVEQTLSEGVEKVVTATKKYSFDDTGLNISSSDSNISTTITEDGMRIYRGREEVLTADNEGVKAEDLHATTFLIIGTTSRLEDRENRTACFWIGD